MEAAVPRLLLAGTGSGCGKTTVCCALLGALKARGVNVGAFKCGPDYIDPMFHRRVTGEDSGTLDPFFFDADTLKYLLARRGAGRTVNVLEGVMGCYDGLGLSTAKSSWEMAELTETPIVLVLDARGAAASLLAELEGFINFVPRSHIAGVIFNRCSTGMYARLAEAVERRFAPAVRSLGFLPPLPDCQLESRHLGLVTPEDTEALDAILDRLAAAGDNLELSLLSVLASEAPPLSFREPELLPAGEPVRVGIARDRAFCFYYPDALDLLEAAGAELIPFSPLEDPALPPGLHGLLLGGGYPELHREALAGNRPLREEIREALAAGLPCVAECGGFLYLNRTLDGKPMTGVLPGESFDAGRLTRFGYVTLRAKSGGLLLPAGGSFPAHEFHRWDCDRPGADFLAEKPDGRRWDCGIHSPTLYAGFPHFHFCASPEAAARFLAACRRKKHRENGEIS